MPHPHLESTRTLPFHQHLGIRFVLTEGGKCVLELPVTDGTANPMKVMHGGIVYAVCWLPTAMPSPR
jgi:acyl-coenzyme A thioesterase PaaI-like protein